MARDLLDMRDVAESVEEARRDVRYFTTDYPVETLVRRFTADPGTEGDIFIPEYQRGMKWLSDRQSYFIESCILRIPIPPMFFHETEGRLEVVDGSQRIRTLKEFVEDKFALEGLERLEILNDYRFSDLPAAVSRRLLNTPVRTFVLEQGTDDTTKVEMFRRLNTSPKNLTEAEIRKGAYQGPFLKLVLECADRPSFKRLVSGKGARGNDPRSERQELVTRFFVYLDQYLAFRHDVRKFLDLHFRNLNASAGPDQLRRMSDEFDAAMTFVEQRMPNAFLRPGSQQVPRVRFEAIAIGSALALRSGRPLRTDDFSWLASTEFGTLVRTDASNSGPRLRSRIEYVRDKLLGGR